MAVKMEKWHINEWSGNMIAHGFCFGHPKLSDGTFINTSVLMEAEFDKEAGAVKFLTMSGNHYEVRLDCINIQPDILEQTALCLERLGVSAGCLNGVWDLVKEKEKRELAEADNLTEGGDLLLEVSENSVIRAFFKQEGGRLHPLDILFHAGMVQDSVLIRKFDVVDYRYFPYPFDMKTYHMSDTIKRLVVWNIGTSEAVLDGKTYVPDTVEKVTVTKDYYEEGLFSPDCVNGKSVMANFLNELSAEGGEEDV